MVHTNKAATINEVCTDLEFAIAAILADLCLKTVKYWVQRLDACKRAHGGNAKEIDLHTQFHWMYFNVNKEFDLYLKHFLFYSKKFQ